MAKFTGIDHGPQAAPPTVQACCGKTHYQPFMHIRVYQDRRGRSRHSYECSVCYKTRHLESRGIRWAERGDGLCKACHEAYRARLAEPVEDDGFDVFARIARNNEVAR